MNKKILIIYAHPDTKGYNQEILKNTIEFLKKEKKDYKLLDLYKLKYNPVLDREEMIIKGGKISLETQKFQKDIKERDNLIFIYPVWWASMPAILKGFMDRVFSAGFAYKYINGMPRGLLNNKKALIFATSGAPDIYNKITFNKFTKSLSKDVLKFCAISSKSKIIGGALNIDKAGENERVKKIVLKHLNGFL
jgi:NAD(P)H dehydrogenase (quinone)